MNVFNLRDRLVSDYQSYTRSFIKIRDVRISEHVSRALGEGAFWPEIGFLDDRDGCLFTATVRRTTVARSVESSVESSGKPGIRSSISSQPGPT